MPESPSTSVQRLLPFAAINAEFGDLTEVPDLATGDFDMSAINRLREQHLLWTLVDGPFGPLFTSGFYRVNRLGYFCSERAVSSEMIVDELPDASVGQCGDCDDMWDRDFSDVCPSCGGETFVRYDGGFG